MEQHSGELTVLVLTLLILAGLLFLTPQLLRAQQRGWDLDHAERMLALEKGLEPEYVDPAVKAAGRTTTLVPIFVVCTAGVVTCFMVAYRPESLFSTSLAIWSVAGVVSLAAITGGIALQGRLAHIAAGIQEEEFQGPGDAEDEEEERRSGYIPRR